MSAATKERPIIMQGESVKAILSGAKTMTRRVVKPQPKLLDPAGRWGWHPRHEVTGEHDWRVGFWSRDWPESATSMLAYYCPFGVVGGRLWVREAWRETGTNMRADGKIPTLTLDEGDDCVYAADDETDGPWRSPIFMPRWASRLTLEITGVRVERLNAISEEDVDAEGLAKWRNAFGCIRDDWKHSDAFARAWDAINGKKHPWSSNPFVFVISFRTLDNREIVG